MKDFEKFAAASALILSILSIGWTWHIDRQLRTLESANVVARHEDITIVNLPPDVCNTHTDCDRIGVDIRNSGRATAKEVEVVVHICYFDAELIFENQSGCKQFFRTTFISDLPANEVGRFGIIDFSHYNLNGSSLKGKKIALLVFVNFRDSLIKDKPRMTRFFAFQYHIGDNRSADGKSVLGHITTDDFDLVCARFKSNLEGAGAKAALIDQLPSCHNGETPPADYPYRRGWLEIVQ